MSDDTDQQTVRYVGTGAYFSQLHEGEKYSFARDEAQAVPADLAADLLGTGSFEEAEEEDAGGATPGVLSQSTDVDSPNSPYDSGEPEATLAKPDLAAMEYSELQTHAKANDIRANQSAKALREQLVGQPPADETGEDE